uniref:Protein kinase domain-containing protein n=1 Tax=Amphimedon queenslandica TaxID=400682 RepID=A0A1X7U9D3_AMPQE
MLGDLRLVNGNRTNIGRLEICIDNEWGTVCDDGWTHTNVEVVCRQLGYSTIGAQYFSEKYYDTGNTSIFLNDFVCLGSEDNILQCNHSTIGSSHNCSRSNGVSVQCFKIDNALCNTELDDQLWSAMSANGICEAYYKDKSSTSICDHLYDPDIDYVYIPYKRLGGSQQDLRQFALQANALIFQIPEHCRDLAIKIMCVHYYLPCGFNGTLHVPLPICSNVCSYMSETLCPDIWSFVVKFLDLNQVAPGYRYDEGIKLPVCNNTAKLIDYLNLTSDCCSDGGIKVPQLTKTAAKVINTSTTPVPHSTTIQTTRSIPLIPASGTPSASNQLTSALIPGMISTSLLLLVVLAIVLSVACCIKKARNRKQLMNKEFSLKTNCSLLLKSNKENIYFSDKTFEISSDYTNQLSKYIISGSSINVQETAGQGEFGIVYRGVMTRENQMPQPVAVKTLKGFYSKSDVDSLLDECIIMMSFDNLNVLPLIGVCLDLGPAPYIIMPFMSRGSLLSYLKKERPNLTVADTSEEDIILNVRKQLLSICLQVGNGMCYLASQKFIHRDLAARNCMIDDDGIIKVADFGLSEDIYSQNYFRQLKGSKDSSSSPVKLPLKWMALESIHDGLFSEKSDVWSYGVLCWEVFSLGRVPYPGLDPAGVVELLDTGGRLYTPNNEACSKEIYSLMTSCWSESPDDRPVFSDLVSSINALIEPLAGYLDFTDINSCVENDIKA